MPTAAELQGRYRDLATRKKGFLARKKVAERQVGELDAEQAALQAKVADLDAAEKLLKGIIEALSAAHLKRLEKFIAYALQQLYPTRDYGFEIEVGTARDASTAEFYLLERDASGEIQRSPLQGSSLQAGTGGAIRTVAGFIAQIYHLDCFGLAPLLFLDEALSAVEAEAVPALAALLQELAARKGYIFVLITQDPRFVPYADRTYWVEQGQARQLTSSEEVKRVLQRVQSEVSG